MSSPLIDMLFGARAKPESGDSKDGCADCPAGYNSKTLFSIFNNLRMRLMDTDDRLCRDMHVLRSRIQRLEDCQRDLPSLTTYLHDAQKTRQGED